MNRKALSLLALPLPLLAVVVACTGEDGADGQAASSTVRSTEEPAGEHCEYGGTKLEFGEADSSGALVEDSVSTVTYVCKGEPGASGPKGDPGPDGFSPELVIDVEPPGEHCANGGTHISSGANETWLCASQQGPQGPQGPQGNAGGQGPAGHTPEVVITPEPEGNNCKAGGVSITVDGGTPTYVCNGEDGEDGAPGAGTGPGFVLVDADGQQVDAWILQAPGVAYGDSYEGYDYGTGVKCVPVAYVGQQSTAELRINLATGRPEPCYTNYADWTAAAKSEGSWLGFSSTDCSGTPYGMVSPPARFEVDGVLYEATGDEVTAGAAAGLAFSNFNGGTCYDQSSYGPYVGHELLPVEPAFADAFDNPPYTVKVAY